MEWSSASFEDYTMTEATISVTCTGTGEATGTFRLELDTSASTLAAVAVSPPPERSLLLHQVGVPALSQGPSAFLESPKPEKKTYYEHTAKYIGKNDSVAEVTRT